MLIPCAIHPCHDTARVRFKRGSLYVCRTHDKMLRHAKLADLHEANDVRIEGDLADCLVDVLLPVVNE